MSPEDRVQRRRDAEVAARAQEEFERRLLESMLSPLTYTADPELRWWSQIR